jgi:hypothetical protein
MVWDVLWNAETAGSWAAQTPAGRRMAWVDGQLTVFRSRREPSAPIPIQRHCRVVCFSLDNALSSRRIRGFGAQCVSFEKQNSGHVVLRFFCLGRPPGECQCQHQHGVAQSAGQAAPWARGAIPGSLLSVSVRPFRNEMVVSQKRTFPALASMRRHGVSAVCCSPLSQSVPHVRVG